MTIGGSYGSCTFRLMGRLRGNMGDERVNVGRMVKPQKCVSVCVWQGGRQGRVCECEGGRVRVCVCVCMAGG